MKKEVIFILPSQFADWEGAFIAPMLNWGGPDKRSEYEVKTMALTKQPVTSAGGFRVLPDYDLETIPEDFAALVLIGSADWFAPENVRFAPIVEKAIRDEKVVAGICNASVFLGMHGFLNEVKHTSNALDYLKQYAGNGYTGEEYYVARQAVRDGNMVTANGTAYLEFCREIQLALHMDTPEKIQESYLFYKRGFCPE